MLGESMDEFDGILEGGRGGEEDGALLWIKRGGGGSDSALLFGCFCQSDHFTSNRKWSPHARRHGAFVALMVANGKRATVFLHCQRRDGRRGRKNEENQEAERRC